MRPYVGPIERQTLANRDFRRVLFTGRHAQLVLMSLRPGEEIGREVHAAVDQFFRVEAGTARFLLAGQPPRDVRAGGAVVVPAKTRHNVVNPSKTKPLKLYTLYAPPNHPPGTVQRTRDDAVAAEASHA
ncbi:MAG: cupin domain-containing protein [Planctomycetota bacterium]